MEKPQDDHWLLEPLNHSSFPYRTEKQSVQSSRFARNKLALTIRHPETPTDHPLKQDIVICTSGWTEPQLGNQAEAAARVGLNAAAFSHPREGALNDLWSLLSASRKLRSNWKELSGAVWDEQDLDHAEHILVDILTDQVADKDDSKTLLKTAVKAGRRRRDNLMLVIDFLREQGYIIHVMGHSLGGVDATMAVKASPDQVRSLLLAGPGGMMTKDSVPEIIPRIASAAIGELWMFRNPSAMARMAINTVLFVAENPLLTLYEGGFAATGRLEPALWAIMADHRIPSILILGGKDPLFPEHIVREDSKNIPFAETIVLPEAGHNMTLHQTAKVARIMGNVALDRHNPRSGRLEGTMENRLARYRRFRPTNAPFTTADMEGDLFNR